MRTLLFSSLRVPARNLRSIFVLPFGFLRYWQTGFTPEAGYQAFVWLFCSTRGRINDWLSSILSRVHPKIDIEVPVGVLGDLRNGKAHMYAEKLRSDGYVLFTRALPNDTCDRLMKFAVETPAIVRRMDNDSPTADRRVALFDPKQPLAVRYDYDTSSLLDNVEVQSLLADPSLLCLVQEYLNCEPVADVLSMWWHTSYQVLPDSEAAQLFHFDMDRIKWLKIFFYLTDVGPENGPHSFIAGSHQTGGIPAHFLRRGYVRLNDEEVYSQYKQHQRMIFTAPRGSIIVEDTRGLHKGAVVQGSPRLVLQLQFSNSLFGANYPRVRMNQIKAKLLARMIERAPNVYKQYI